MTLCPGRQGLALFAGAAGGPLCSLPRALSQVDLCLRGLHFPFLSTVYVGDSPGLLVTNQTEISVTKGLESFMLQKIMKLALTKYILRGPLSSYFLETVQLAAQLSHRQGFLKF